MRKVERLGNSSKSSCYLYMGAAFLLLLATGCDRSSNEPMSPLTMVLRSASISNGILGKAYTCDGQGISPQLSWDAPPRGTRSLALVVTDRDSPLGFNFVHWVMYNIAPSTRELPPEILIQQKLPGGAEQGLASNDKPGYTPPCPHGKSVHRYDFVLYAIDSDVNVSSASKKQLLDALRDHVLARGELIARYGR